MNTISIADYRHGVTNTNDIGKHGLTVCHSHGEYARDEDGDGHHEIHDIQNHPSH